jgi:hypothetical protein
MVPVLLYDLLHLVQQLHRFIDDVGLCAVGILIAGLWRFIPFQRVEEAALVGVVVGQFLFFEAILTLFRTKALFFVGEEGPDGCYR